MDGTELHILPHITFPHDGFVVQHQRAPSWVGAGRPRGPLVMERLADLVAVMESSKLPLYVNSGVLAAITQNLLNTRTLMSLASLRPAPGRGPESIMFLLHPLPTPVPGPERRRTCIRDGVLTGARLPSQLKCVLFPKLSLSHLPFSVQYQWELRASVYGEPSRLPIAALSVELNKDFLELDMY